MNRLLEWSRRLWHLLHRRRFDEDLRLEMDAHRAMLDDPARFGNPLRLREEARDVWGWPRVEALARDLRHGARALRRAPAFTTLAVGSLALGLALVTATAAVVDAYSLSALPYPEADRLYRVRYAPPGPWEPGGLSAFDWTSVDDVVEFAITAASDTFYLTDGEYRQSARALRVSGGFLHGLGVRAVMGRSLADADFRAGSDRVAVIGHGLWRDRYGSDPGVLGRSLRVEVETMGTSETYRIVGVLPPRFYFGRDSRDVVDVLAPLAAPARTYMVRLRSGVPAAHAERRLTEAVRKIATDLRSGWTGVELESVHEQYVAALRPVLRAVGTASALVLVIACANVAVLVVLRLLRRHHEIAVRAALGSTRGHLTRMLLAETGLLCGAALGIGLALTAPGLRALTPLIEAQLGRPAAAGAGAIGLDGSVLFVVGAIGVLVVLSLSCLPALLPQRRLVDVLRGSGRAGTDGRWPRRVRSALIAIEVAGALVLLAAGSLLTASVVAMLRTDLGYEPEALVRSRIVLRGADYPDGSAFTRFYEPFAQRLAAATGAAVVFTNWPPFIEFPTLLVEADASASDALRAGAMTVSAGYFTAFSIEMRGGRDFAARDMDAGEPVVVVSETLARQLWSNGPALGRYVRTMEETPAGPRRSRWRRVIGVAADARQTYADRDLRDIYLPMTPAAFGRFGSFYLSAGASPALWDSTRRIAAALDPHAIVDRPRAVWSENRELAGTTFLTGLLTAFAFVAAFVTVLGIYAVTAYAVQQRERELAIRVALGAARRDVTRLFLKESALVLGAGLALGAPAAAALVRLFNSQLYGVKSFELSMLAAMAASLAAAGALAAWWPARRAAARNPARALKEA
jgi:predicted permease